jgi:hypothetical protein
MELTSNSKIKRKLKGSVKFGAELSDFPLVALHVRDAESLYSTLEWQRVGARAIVRHYLNLDAVLQLTIEQCRLVTHYWTFPFTAMTSLDVRLFHVHTTINIKDK